ncbi:DUF1345 domain-containing protein [Fluviicola taffensis]|uniref:DUF1345 domain-containing protein n=1 Tax=Fluviicola taffensis TaxID=191579 RepID=UPI00313774F1
MKFIRFKILFVFLISFIVGIIFYALKWSIQESIVFSWLTFGGLYILESLITIIRIPSKQIMMRAKYEDLGVWMQFIVLVIACATALIAIIFWNSDNNIHFSKHSTIHEIFFIASVTLAWMVLHLSFTFRYAHLYYGDENKKYAKHAGGLDFPDDSNPDYFDFAYYSFTIGMTFQVSDVVIKSKGLRRLTLAHSLLAFFFNTILVAITINEIINL